MASKTGERTDKRQYRDRIFQGRLEVDLLRLQTDLPQADQRDGAKGADLDPGGQQFVEARRETEVDVLRARLPVHRGEAVPVGSKP